VLSGWLHYPSGRELAARVRGRPKQCMPWDCVGLHRPGTRAVLQRPDYPGL